MIKERQNVESSLIVSVGYDSSNATMEIEFKNDGTVWQYYAVAENDYYEFISSRSVEKYFLNNIKGR